MKNAVIAMIAGIALGGAGTWFYLQRAAPGAAPAPAAETESAPEKSLVQHDTNGTAFLKLDPATQTRMGLKVQPLAAASLSPEVHAYGRVLDASSFAKTVTDLRAALAARDTSAAELKRLQTLARDGNASDRALQTAQAAAARDDSQVELLRQQLIAAWGTGLIQRPDLPALAQSLLAQESVLVQVSLPAGEVPEAAPAGAEVASMTANTAPVAAQIIGPAPMVDPQLQGRGYLLLIAGNPQHLAPGAAVTGFLKHSGEPAAGVTMPADALVRHNGSTWFYLQTGDDTFQRTGVTLGRRLAGGWFVQEGVKPQDKVVIVGAQQLLSEELKGQGGGEE